MGVNVERGFESLCCCAAGRDGFGCFCEFPLAALEMGMDTVLWGPDGRVGLF